MAGGNNTYPIKLVNIRKEDIKPNRGNGDENKVFCDVTPELRRGFSNQVETVERIFEQRFKEHPTTPAVAKVTLRTEAIAKSHRPTSLFSSSTCPIIGIGNSNELFIEVNTERLNSLKKKIMTSDAKIVEANISTLDNITPYLPNDALKVEIKDFIIKEELTFVKVKLFKFFNEKTNKNVEQEFEEHLLKKGAKILKKIYYAKHLTVYKVELKNTNNLEEICEFGGVKSLSYFPEIKTTELTDIKLKPDVEGLPVFLPESGKEYPYVGVVDSGIREDNIYLKDWVEHREDFVLPTEKNCNHGSFVSGIIAYNDRLISRSDTYDGVKIIDITAIPNSSSEYGPVGTLDEDELVEILREVVPKYSGLVKVWNLSLNSDNMCDEQGFSDLAISLDEIQDENDVTFVISAGNYSESPLRTWPVNNANDYCDVITSPADSVRAITVGSISHVDSDLAKAYCPSPFSRRGPGPNYITKPELVDFGGNITTSPRIGYNGVTSFSETGQLVEDIGTSFSAPRISALLAKIHHYLEYRPSRSLAKALIIHSAIDKRINKRPDKEERPYLGFGQPQNLNSILECTEHSSTIIFEGTINPSTYIEITDFPFPKVLTEGGKCFGEIYVTLVYNPPLNSDYSFEYCRSNIDVSLGTTKPNGYKGEVPIERMGSLEKELVENGLKWAPIKVYHRKIVNGIGDNPWKLKLTLSGRSGEVLEPQDFTLIVTIRDPQNEKEVYSDIAQQLQQRFVYSDIQISNRVRPTI